MKITVPLVLCLSGSAAAQPLTLTPVAAPTQAPRIVFNEEQCSGQNDRIRPTRRGLGKRRVSVLHQCGASDVNAELAFEGKGKNDGWQIWTSALIAYHGANMTDAPLHVKLIDEEITFGTIDADPGALVYRVETLYENVRSDGSVEDSHRRTDLDVCVLRDGNPWCGHTSYVCAPSGCGKPLLKQGVLSFVSKQGRERLTIE